MPICASCGLEVARSGFTKAQLGKKDSRRCRQCVTEQEPDAPSPTAAALSARGPADADDLSAAGILRGASNAVSPFLTHL